MQVGNTSKALQLLERVMEVQMRTLGKEHLDTLRSISTLEELKKKQEISEVTAA